MNHQLRMAAAVLGVAACFSAAAQNTARYPERPIRVVMPFPAGGTVDVVARLIADEMGKTLGKPLVMREMKPMLSSRASFSNRPTRTSIPAARNLAKP